MDYIVEGSSADDMLEVAENRSKESEQNYTVEEKTFGDVTYSYFIPEFGSKTLYGTINDTTVCISHDSDIDIDDDAVQSIIASIEVAAK